MMSSQSAPSSVKPVYESKMPFFDGTLPSAGRPKPGDMFGFLSKQALPCSGTYFTFNSRNKDGTAFTPWTGSKASTSPASHHAGVEAQTTRWQEQDVSPAQERLPRPLSVCQTPGKRGFAYYAKSPGGGSPANATSPTVRKPQRREGSSTPPPENSGYLAIPKPMYAHNPCCSAVGCMLGQRYPMERGCQRISNPNPVYEGGLMPPGARYAQPPAFQRSAAAHDSLQHRGLHYDSTPEQSPLAYCGLSLGGARDLPVYLDSSYRGYPCAAPQAMLRSLSEPSQHLQTSPRSYHGLYPPHHTYEHMTSDIYQAHSPMSKYGLLTQHPMFFYPPADAEVESRTQCKDTAGGKRGDVPVTLKRPQENNISPPAHREMLTLPNHSLGQGFKYPTYPVPRMSTGACKVKDLRNRVSSAKLHYVSPPRQHLAAAVSSANLHKGHLKASALLDQAYSSPQFLQQQRQQQQQQQQQADQSGPTRHTDAVSPSRTPVSKMFSPGGGLKVESGHACPVGLNIDRFLNGSPAEGLAASRQYPQLTALPGLPPPPPSHFMHTSAVLRLTEDNGRLKRKAVVKVKEDGLNVVDVSMWRKFPKLDMSDVKAEEDDDSPLMPVIDKVFSLATCTGYVHAPAVLVQPAKTHEPRARTPEPKGPDGDDSKKTDPQETEVQRKDQSGGTEMAVKMEDVDTCVSDGELVTEPSKQEPEDLETTAVENEILDLSKTGMESSKSPKQNPETSSELPCPGEVATPKEAAQTPTATADPQMLLHNDALCLTIPPHCLKLSAINIVLPDNMESGTIPSLLKPPIQAMDNPKNKYNIPVRKHFIELHQSLCKLINKSVCVSSEQELRTWLSHLKMAEDTSTKVPKVSCLLGVQARQAWLNEEVRSALQQVTERLREYMALDRCPFPHVMRTGAVFIPMLVLKELLFPNVEGGFIDQVLQEHKVELRPTTLSEEKILIQLHKRASSSKLRRLMSLKHLPDIYADVVNLFHHAIVCKHLGLNTDGRVLRGPDEGGADVNVLRSPASPVAVASPVSAPDALRSTERHRAESGFRRGGGAEGSRERCDEGAAAPGEETGNGGATCDGGCVSHRSEGTDRTEIEQPVSEDCQTPDQSWTNPLTADELSSSASDTETEGAPTSRAGNKTLETVKSQDRPNKCAGVILKLRRIIFSKGLHRKKALYQAVSDPGSVVSPCASQNPDEPKPVRRGSGGAPGSPCRTAQAVPHWQGAAAFSHALRPLRSSSKRQHGSLLKIKYCPFLSVCHSAEHRRKWVLRSAVHRARRAMRLCYPDLVGKRILHLYEEDDKSEVWYKGEVLRVHEAHSNPQKTIFEVRYDSEPEWRYYLELLIDYEKGWLKIED